MQHGFYAIRSCIYLLFTFDLRREHDSRWEGEQLSPICAGADPLTASVWRVHLQQTFNDIGPASDRDSISVSLAG
jgi:hypothetical protein